MSSIRPCSRLDTLDNIDTEKTVHIPKLLHCSQIHITKGLISTSFRILPVAQTSKIVFISTKLLSFCLRLVLAKAFVNHRPYDIIVLHLEKFLGITKSIIGVAYFFLGI